jgi:type II secretory pathway pseudopilin PulG
MNARAHNKRGLTLIEMTLVVGTIALLVGFGVPAVRSLLHSMQTEAGVHSMIDAALSSAQAMAMTRQRYVGIRFQKRCTSTDSSNPLAGLIDAPQYMIFIMQEEPASMGGLGNGFKAIEGFEPIKLPETVGVMDINSVGSSGRAPTDLLLKKDYALSDVTTFSIVFSPSGRLVMHQVRVRNRNGVRLPDNSDSAKASRDSVFNSVINICQYKVGMFIQDDYCLKLSTPGPVELGLGQELSTAQFVIYDVPTFRALYTGAALTDLQRYLTLLDASQTVNVNVYTGHLIPSK